MEAVPLTLFEKDWHTEDILQREVRSLLIFRLSDEWYALDLHYVREVLPIPSKITPVPFVKEWVAGIVKFRGNVISVMDLEVLFKLPRTDLHQGGCLVVVEDGRATTGLWVENSIETREVPADSLEPGAPGLDAEKRKWVEAQTNLNGRIVTLLNLRKLLELKPARDR